MNRKKRTSQIGVPTLILLFVALAILCTGGVTYVVMKNRQITARREMEKVQQRMDEHRVSITLHQTDIEVALDVYDIRKKISDGVLPLAEIPAGVVEVVSADSEKPSSDERIVQR